MTVSSDDSKGSISVAVAVVYRYTGSSTSEYEYCCTLCSASRMYRVVAENVQLVDFTSTTEFTCRISQNVDG